MKTLIVFFALVALAFAYPGGHGEEHGGAEHETEVKHGHPVVTGVFKNPGLGHFNNYAPKIDGPLPTRGIGPHIKHH